MLIPTTPALISHNRWVQSPPLLFGDADWIHHHVQQQGWLISNGRE